MPASPTASPLTLRARRLSLYSGIDKHRKSGEGVSEGPAHRGPTSSRSRCLVRPSPATACRAAHNTFRIWGFQEGGEKNGAEKRPDWPHSRLIELGNSTFIYKMMIYMTRQRPVADTARGVGPNYFSNLCHPSHISRHHKSFITLTVL